MADLTVKTEGVIKEYRMGSNILQALKGIDIEIERGEYISLMGPSGSGKTTLFNMIGALDRATSGKVYIDGQDMAQLDQHQIAWLRCNKIGYIFQTFNLLPVMTALENVTLPMIFAGLSLKDRNEKGAKLLERVGLGERLHHKPDELSGGQRQRVAIARGRPVRPRWWPGGVLVLNVRDHHYVVGIRTVIILRCHHGRTREWRKGRIIDHRRM